MHQRVMCDCSYMQACHVILYLAEDKKRGILALQEHTHSRTPARMQALLQRLNETHKLPDPTAVDMGTLFEKIRNVVFGKLSDETWTSAYDSAYREPAPPCRVPTWPSCGLPGSLAPFLEHHKHKHESGCTRCAHRASRRFDAPLLA